MLSALVDQGEQLSRMPWLQSFELQTGAYADGAKGAVATSARVQRSLGCGCWGLEGPGQAPS